MLNLMLNVEVAGLRAVAESDQLMGYGNSIGRRWKVLSRMQWRIELPGSRPIYVEATHRIVDGIESTTLVQYIRAGVYSMPCERELPGSGKGRPGQAVRTLLEQLAVVYWLGRLLLEHPAAHAVDRA